MSQSQATTSSEVGTATSAPPLDVTGCTHPKAALLLEIAAKCEDRHSANPKLAALAEIAHRPPETVRARALVDGTNAKFVAECLSDPVTNLGQLVDALGIDLARAQELFCDHGPEMSGQDMAARFRKLAQKGTLARVSRR